MANYQQLLNEARGRISQHESEIRDRFTSIGEKVLESPPSEKSAQLAELLKAIRDIDEKTSGYDTIIRRIREIESRQSDIREELATNADEIRRLHRDNAAYFESIGEAAYEYFRRNPEAAETYSGIFEPVVAVHDELSRIQNDISAAEHELERKGFFDKVVVRGRLALLRTRQANKEGSIPKHLYRIGERIVATNFPEEADSSDLNQAMEPYRLNQRQIEELESKQTELEEEQERLSTELEEAGVTRRPSKRIREIEALKAENDKRRAELVGQLGEVALETDGIVADGDEDAQELRERREAISVEESRIERLEAAIEAERIEEQMHRIERDISSKNQTISDLKKEVTALKKQKTELQTQRDQAVERRGDTEDLLALEGQGEQLEPQRDNDG